ncbi:hypothetical protein ACFSTC_11035 [Nonomuraea ferruginea]
MIARTAERDPAHEHVEQLGVGGVGVVPVADDQGEAGLHDLPDELGDPVGQPERAAGRGDEDALLVGQPRVEGHPPGGHEIRERGRDGPDLDVMLGHQLGAPVEGLRHQSPRSAAPTV